MYLSSRLHSTLNTGYITALDMYVSSMYRSSRFRSTLHRGYIAALDMCQVCTEAVDSVAVTPWKEKTQKRFPGFRAVGIYMNRKRKESTCPYSIVIHVDTIAKTYIMDEDKIRAAGAADGTLLQHFSTALSFPILLYNALLQYLPFSPPLLYATPFSNTSLQLFPNTSLQDLSPPTILYNIGSSIGPNIFTCHVSIINAWVGEISKVRADPVNSEHALRTSS